MPELTHALYVERVAKGKSNTKVIGIFKSKDYPITHECLTCSSRFKMKPVSILWGKGCSTCVKVTGRKPAKTHKMYVEQLTHRKSVMRPVETYKGDAVGINHKCPKGHVVNVKPGNVIQGQGCRMCSNRTGSTSRGGYTHEEYVDKVSKISPSIKVKGTYSGAHCKIEFKCSTCKYNWVTTPSSVLNARTGCPCCNRCKNDASGRSYNASAWIEYMSKKLRLSFTHAGNGGEHRITLPDGKVVHVDGFNRRKGIVLEYHGDNWHGNPKLYSPRSRPNPFRPDATARRLYKETMDREEAIRSMGYIVISIWESDWKLNKAYVSPYARRKAKGM